MGTEEEERLRAEVERLTTENRAIRETCTAHERNLDAVALLCAPATPRGTVTLQRYAADLVRERDESRAEIEEERRTAALWKARHAVDVSALEDEVARLRASTGAPRGGESPLGWQAFGRATAERDEAVAAMARALDAARDSRAEVERVRANHAAEMWRQHDRTVVLRDENAALVEQLCRAQQARTEQGAALTRSFVEKLKTVNAAQAAEIARLKAERAEPEDDPDLEERLGGFGHRPR